jgi:hypothetical protein
MGVGSQCHAPATLPPGKTRYPLYRRLGGPQSRSGRVRKISPQPGFDPRTVQPAASRYTDWAILAPTQDQILVKFIKIDLWRRSQVWPWMRREGIDQQQSYMHLLGPSPSICLGFLIDICRFISPCVCLFDVHLFEVSPDSFPRSLWGQPNTNYWSTAI